MASSRLIDGKLALLVVVGLGVSGAAGGRAWAMFKAGRGQVVRQLAEWLTGPAAAQWDLLDFDGVAQDDCLLGQLADELAIAGHTVFRRTRQRTWRLSLPRARFISGRITDKATGRPVRALVGYLLLLASP